MNTRGPLRQPWARLGATVLALGAFGLAAHHTPAPALINESASLPQGLYLRAPGAPLERGAVVAVPQPAAARVYLRGLGMPGDLPLLKRVAAVGGDRVCRRGDGVVAAAREVSILERDRRGTRLPAWTGCRRLAPDELFLLGDTPGSFDSRYFGPVRITDVDGVFREVVTW